jgi:hypothetical protein
MPPCCRQKKRRWSGVDAADYQWVMVREVKEYDIFEPFRRKGEQCD